MIRSLLVTLLLLAPVSVRAADIPYALYAAGKYDEAMKAGEAEKTAWGNVVAARAALGDAQTRAKPCLACLEKAIVYAEKASRLDPKMADARTFRAVAIGYKARIVGMIEARMKNYPKRAKEDLDKALASDPKNVWALGALGGWHVEIVRTGGSYLANMFYSANIKEGLAAFAAAFKSDPDNLPVRFQYGLSLSGYDADQYENEILDSFALVAKMTPRTSYERIAQGRAAELVVLWKKKDRTGFDKLVRRYQGYP